MSEVVHVVGFGARTCVGLSAAHTAAAALAGVSGYARHRVFTGRDGQALVTAHDRLLAIEALDSRLATLFAHALSEVMEAPALAHADGLALHLAVPDRRDAAPLIAKLPAQLRVGSISDGGRGADFVALSRALAELRGGQASIAVVAGVDSLLDPQRIHALREANQLRCSVNRWGRVPGEAGVCCVLATQAAVAALGLPSLGRLHAVACVELEHRPPRGRVGLTAAFADVLDVAPEQPVTQLYGDIGEDRACADEYAFAVMHQRARLRDPSKLVDGVTRWGDVGAAGGLLLLLVATTRARREGGATSLLWSVAESNLRAAALFEAHPPASQ